MFHNALNLIYTLRVRYISFLILDQYQWFCIYICTDMVLTSIFPFILPIKYSLPWRGSFIENKIKGHCSKDVKVKGCYHEVLFCFWIACLIKLACLSVNRSRSSSSGSLLSFSISDKTPSSEPRFVADNLSKVSLKPFCII